MDLLNPGTSVPIFVISSHTEVLRKNHITNTKPNKIDFDKYLDKLVPILQNMSKPIEEVILLQWQRDFKKTVIGDLEKRKRGEKTPAGTVVAGPPGTGKSFGVNDVVKEIIKSFPELMIAVTATTGAAATRLNGAKTLASWLSIGGEAMKLHNLEAILPVILDKNPKTLRNTCILIIDEVSMLSQRHLFHLKTIIEQVREDPQSYGGIYMILIGDPFQLPPVAHDLGPGIYRNVTEFVPSCLETQYADFNYVVANKMKRSEDDPKLQQVLLQLISPDQIVRASAIQTILDECLRGGGTMTPYQILALHRETGAVILSNVREGEYSVNSYNYADEQSLKETEGYEEFTVEPVARTHDPNDKELIKKVGGKLQLQAEEYALLSRDTFLTEPKVRTNTPYMVRVNTVVDGTSLVNGDTGNVIRINDDASLEFYSHRHKKEVTIRPVQLPSEWIPEIGFCGYPIIRASAITVHKAQGATFHNGIIVDMRRIYYDNYMAHKLYTALSRVKRLKDIYLVSYILPGFLDDPTITKKLQYIWKLDYMKEYLRPKDIA